LTGCSSLLSYFTGGRPNCFWLGQLSVALPVPHLLDETGRLLNSLFCGSLLAGDWSIRA
jgi:hypothetical protein